MSEEYKVALQFAILDTSLLTTLAAMSKRLKGIDEQFKLLNASVKTFGDIAGKSFVDLSKRMDASASRAANLRKELTSIRDAASSIKFTGMGIPSTAGSSSSRHRKSASAAEAMVDSATVYGVTPYAEAPSRVYPVATRGGGLVPYGMQSGNIMRDVYGFDETVGAGGGSSGGGGRSGWNGRGYTGGRSFNFRDGMHNAASKAFDGMMLGGVGYGGIEILNKTLDKGLEYQRYVASLRQQGLGDSQIEDAKKFVQATDVINTSMIDRMRIFSEAQGSFRESGKSGSEALHAAKMMMPVLATYEVAMSTLSGDKHAAAEGAMRNLNKTVEIMGGLGDVQRAKDITDGVFKAAQSSGKMVDERQLKQFVAYGASATNQLSLRTIFGGLEPIIGELGGSTAAVGLRTAYTRTNGMMSLPPKLLLAEMRRLGMTDASGRKQTDVLAKLQATNAIDYAQEMLKRYASAGITSRTDIERENAIIFGTNGSKVYNKIMSQMPVLMESLASYDKAQGASQTVNDPNNKAIMAKHLFAKRWEDFQLAIAQDGGLLDMATKALTLMAGAIKSVTEFAKNHPILTKFALGGLAIVSTVMVLGGAFLLFSAGLGALNLVFISFPMAVLSKLPVLFSMTGVAINTFGSGLVSLMAVLAAAYAGYKVGSMIYDNLSTDHQNMIGSGIAHTLAFFGNQTAQDAIAQNNKKSSPNIRTGSHAQKPADIVLQLNAREVARSTAQHLGREAYRPATAATSFDSLMTPAPVGIGVMR